MGCDIHTRAEVFRQPYTYKLHKGEEVTVPGKWRMIKDHMFDNLSFQEDRPIQGWNVPMQMEPYSGRNYTLFAWLADVRNYRDGLEPLADPRGVPEDASKGWKKYVKKWDCDLHSKSYFTLQELIDSEAKARNYQYWESGVINLEQYLELKKGNLPEWWSMWSNRFTISSEDYEALSEEGKAELLHKDNGLSADGTAIETKWKRPLWDSVSSFYEHTVERMKNLIPHDGTASDVRLVFGFDN